MKEESILVCKCKTTNITKRIFWHIDISDWVFPIAFNLTCCGNNNRPYNFMIKFLCFSLIYGIDEDSYMTYDYEGSEE